MIFDQSPFEYASQHVHLITWPVLIGFAWKISRFFTRQEIQVTEDRVKLTEAHEATQTIAAQWERQNSTLIKMVDSLQQVQRDFHDHVVEDKFTAELVSRNQDTIIRGIEDIKRAQT